MTRQSQENEERYPAPSSPLSAAGLTSKALTIAGLLLVVIAAIAWMLDLALNPLTLALLGCAIIPLPAIWQQICRIVNNSQSDTQKPHSHDLQLARKPIIPAASLAGEQDTLTGLYDRKALEQTVNAAVRRGHNAQNQLFLIAFDIDRLKDINGCFGFTVGDDVLKITAQRLSGIGADIVVRLGGDRFAALFSNFEAEMSAELIGAACLDRISQPFTCDAGSRIEVSPSASAGIAIFPSHGGNFNELFQSAELAVDASKRAGGRRCSVFENAMIERLRRRRSIEHDLKLAIENNRLHLVFQPQIDLATGIIFGAEALMRWNDPERGMIPPSVFIPVAETTGLIKPLGKWLIEEACRCAKRWRERDIDLVLAINISTAQLRQHDLIECIADTLSQHQLAPGDIELELTESLFVDPAELMMRRTLENLARMGVGLAIDDFGTGFSALAYLKRLPVSKIKIDKSFISGIGREAVDEGLIRSIIGIGRTFEKTVLAEGVENEAQLAFLRREGCHQAQGYYFARPLGFEACSTMALRQRDSLGQQKLKSRRAG